MHALNARVQSVVLILLIADPGLATACGAESQTSAENNREFPELSFASPRWMETWQVDRHRKMGWNNIQITNDPQDSLRGPFLRVRYPRGSASPTVTKNDGAPVGGANFYARLGIRPRDSLHLRYDVRFADGFNFVKGGKLPGLFGGTVMNGRHIPDGENGLSTRYMWRENGKGEVYAYMPTSIEHGTSLGRGRWWFRPGRWYCLEQQVDLNTPGRADGRIQVWVDGKPVLDARKLIFRTVEDLKIEGIFFSTFFGGGDSSWATPRTTYADFARFAVSDQYIGP